MRRIGALVLLASSVAAAAAQQEIPRFKSGVDIVQFTVTVTDADRRPVAGLTAADFEVLVDGVPRSLAAFAEVTLPGETPTSVVSIPAVAPDVNTNRLPPEGRLVVIVMDRSTPDGQPLKAARETAHAAVDRLGPADLGAVIFTAAGSQKYSQGFTADRARLHAAIDQALLGIAQELPELLSLSGTVASRGAPARGAPQNSVQLASEELSGECRCGVCVPNALTELAKVLSSVTTVRHKSILFVGSDVAVATRSLDCNAYVYPARDRLIRALDEANVIFHVLDPRALEGLGHTAEADSPVGRAPQGANLYRQELLTILPDHTGGRFVMNRNTPWDRIGPIFDESRSYYVLAVARSPVAGGAQDQHRISISVKRPDAVVRTRNLSFAEDPRETAKPAENAAVTALKGLLPRADFPLQMNLVPQFSADGSAEIRVLLGVEPGAAGAFDAIIGAFDNQFKPAGTLLKQRLDVPSPAAFQWTSVLDPPPGHYEVRAGLATADGKRAASVIGYVDVPDVAKEELSLSGIVVKSGEKPTISRAFAPAETIALSFQVARAKNQRANLAVRCLLSDEIGQILATVDVPRGERAATNGVESREIAVRLPSAPGQYIVSIEAGDGRRTVRRDVPLTVR